MSTKDLAERVKNEVSSFNTRITNTPGKLQFTVPNFRQFTSEGQQSEIQKAKTQIRAESRQKALDLQAEVAKEKRDVTLKVGKIKFPNATNTDPSLRAAGETQINSALLFLSTPKSTSAIVSAVKNAFEMNRPEFAFTVTDSILTEYEGKRETVPQSHTDRDKAKRLTESLHELVKTFSGKAQLDEVEAELDGFRPLETMTEEFVEQLDRGGKLLYCRNSTPC